MSGEKYLSSAEFDTNSIFKLYTNEKIEQPDFHDSSRSENDIRYMYVIESPDIEKSVIKVTKNSFTTQERIRGWAKLCDHYNSLGIYCPRILKNKAGKYSADVDGYTVYAEEFMKYTLLSPDGRKNELPDCQKRIFESIGLVAANPPALAPWNTAYCLYDKFSESDLYDENYECALEFYNFFQTFQISSPRYSARAKTLFNTYVQKRKAFEKAYKTLPKAVFQGDLNSSNILVDENGDFKGVIDFNLSGTETILNYIFCECCCYLETEEEIGLLTDKDCLRMRDEKTAKNLSYACTYYKFTDAEKNAFPHYYNIVMPFRWPYHSFFLKLLRGGKLQYADKILDWVEYQLTRNDVKCLLR